MNTPTNPVAATPAPTTVPEGMVRIEIAREGKQLKRVTVKTYGPTELAGYAKNAFGTSEFAGVEILAVFVNPQSGNHTVVYGLY